MVHYVYYDPSTMQIEALFDTPNLSPQANWEARGLRSAVIGDGVDATRDHRIASFNADGSIASCTDSVNSVQVQPEPRRLLDNLQDKLAADTITDVEIRQMMRIERGQEENPLA